MTGVSTDKLSGSTTDVQLDIGALLVRVRSDLQGVGEHLKLLYEDFSLADGADGHVDIAVVSTPGVRRWVRRQATLVVNGRRPFLPLPASLAGPLFEWGLNWAIGHKCHRWVAVHAAVAERDGAAVILCAPSGSGKSTLCAALVYAGWRLLSDEFALIDPDTGLLTPSPRPISLKNASIEITRQRHPDVICSTERVDIEGARFVHACPPSDSVRRAHETAVPRWIVFPRYVAGHTTDLRPMSRARTLMELCDQSFNYNYLGTRGFTCLAKMVEQADPYSFAYSSLDEAIACFAALPTR